MRHVYSLPNIGKYIGSITDSYGTHRGFAGVVLFTESSLCDGVGIGRIDLLTPSDARVLHVTIEGQCDLFEGEVSRGNWRLLVRSAGDRFQEVSSEVVPRRAIVYTLRPTALKVDAERRRSEGGLGGHPRFKLLISQCWDFSSDFVEARNA